MMFVQEWIAQDTLDEMGRLVRSVAGLEGDVVEFGCWEGRSTVVLANAAHPDPVHAVDHWQGSPTLTIEEYAPDRDVRAIFHRNVAELTAGNVVTHDMSTAAFRAAYAGPGLKFIHIDADHEYQAVAEEIRWALANTLPGGIICGDDYKPYWHGVVRAVDELVPGRTLHNCMWVWRVPS